MRNKVVAADAPRYGHSSLQGRRKRAQTILSGWAGAQEKEMDLNDITYKINGAVFEVNRVLGSGFLEKVYENALLLELKGQGLKAENQVPLEVYYKGKVVGEYVVDILVEDAVILELKAVDQIQKIEASCSRLQGIFDRKEFCHF